jgi:hypothetical protein
VLSSVLLAWMSFVFVRDTEGSTLAGVAAGALAILMPWRMTEMSHLQLLNVQWFPLIWLLLARILEGRAGALSVVALSLSMSIQVLSSVYLAYFAVLSSVALTATLLIWHRHRLGRIAIQLTAAAVLPAALLIVTSLPYLQADDPRGISLFRDLIGFGFVKAFGVLSPVGVPPDFRGAGQFAIPLVVIALAACSLLPRHNAGKEDGSSIRPTTARPAALWSIIIVAFLVSAGPRESGVDGLFPMPYDLLSSVVPGFSSLRAPSRWTILVGIAAPLLAGIGLSRLVRLVWRPSFPTWLRKEFLMAAVLAVFVAWMGIPKIPVHRALAFPKQLRVYEVLADLPDGPVLEVPWKIAQGNVQLESQYTLASTLHWKPILNGFTGYRPPSYAFLRQIGWSLPDAQALEQLTRLASLRWLVVHKTLNIPKPEQRMWIQLVKSGVLLLRYEDDFAYILEVADRSQAGIWTNDLLGKTARSTTFAGTEKKVISAADSIGAITAKPPASVFSTSPLGFASEYAVRVAVRNDSDMTWPAFDSDPEGLVRLRVRFFSDDRKKPVSIQIRPFTSDIEPGSVEWASVLISPPSRPGPYRLTIDLVQRIDSVDVPIDIRAMETTIQVETR